MISNQVAVALYNTEKKHLIGVFKSSKLASKYLFRSYKEVHADRINNALHAKGRVYEGIIFDYPVAVRPANQTQLLLLKDSACFINQEYPQRMNDKGQLLS